MMTPAGRRDEGAGQGPRRRVTVDRPAGPHDRPSARDRDEGAEQGPRRRVLLLTGQQDPMTVHQRGTAAVIEEGASDNTPSQSCRTLTDGRPDTPRPQSAPLCPDTCSRGPPGKAHSVPTTTPQWQKCRELICIIVIQPGCLSTLRPLSANVCSKARSTMANIAVKWSDKVNSGVK